MQLESTNHVIYQELEEGVQDTEGARCWLSKKREDLQSLGRDLTNSEIYDFCIRCEIVSDYRLFTVIRTHCLTADFVNDLEDLKRGSPQKKFACQLSIFWNMANSDSKRGKFGSAEIYDGAIIPLPKVITAYQDREEAISRKAKAKERRKGEWFLDITGGG